MLVLGVGRSVGKSSLLLVGILSSDALLWLGLDLTQFPSGVATTDTHAERRDMGDRVVQ